MSTAIKTQTAASAATIEEILRTTGLYVCTTSGVSMWPMLRDRRDTVVIRPVSRRLQKYEIALYRRNGAYVLHRVVAVHPDSYVICGDNCMEKEYGITDSQILGVLTECCRGEKNLDLSGFRYRLYVRIWCALHPVRRFCKRLYLFLRKMLVRK